MASITVDQARKYASDAGFKGAALATIVAIAYAESGLEPRARNINDNGTVDRGILQINSIWNSQTLRPDQRIPDECAYDPACAFHAAYATITQQGRKFTDWVTFNRGTYKKYLNNPPDPQTGGASETPVLGGLGDAAGAAGNAIGGAMDPGNWAASIGNGMAQGFASLIKWVAPHIIFIGGGAIVLYLLLKQLAPPVVPVPV